MAITNGYATLAVYKAHYYPAGITDTTDDAVIENVIEAASRQIDNYCGRRFFRNSSDETRYYTARWEDALYPEDDIGSVTTLKTDDDGDRTYENTWATTDYDLMPFNRALGAGGVGEAQPASWIEITPEGNYSFPLVARGVEIVGKFGYSTTEPDAVNEACLLQAHRLFKRRDAPFGVIGGGGLGTVNAIEIPDFDADVKQLLNPYRRFV